MLPSAVAVGHGVGRERGTSFPSRTVLTCRCQSACFSRLGVESATHQYARTMFGVGIPEIVALWILVAFAVWLLVRRKAH